MMISNLNRRVLLAAVALPMAAFASTFVSAQPAEFSHDAMHVSQLAAADKKEEPKGDPVPLDKLPKAVVDAVKKALPGARIVKAAKLADGNYFLDDVKVGKKEFDVTVTPEGKILKSEEMKDND